MKHAAMLYCISSSSDANGDTASPSSSDYTEADSDRKGDLATGPRGLCFSMYKIYVDFVMDTCTDNGAEEQQGCHRLGQRHFTNVCLLPLFHNPPHFKLYLCFNLSCFLGSFEVLCLNKTII